MLELMDDYNYLFWATGLFAMLFTFLIACVAFRLGRSHSGSKYVDETGQNGKIRVMSDGAWAIGAVAALAPTAIYIILAVSWY